MCGISGVFGHDGRETVRLMLESLSHRGPDDEFLVANACFALGARRLSIVDVSGGRQPISNEDGTIWAAQNGEIYNAPSLQRQLQARGHRFRSHCDTESIPHLYEDHGDGFVERIDGMFAAAVWDDRQKIGFLARDRMGKKPLYYLQAEGSLYFASEIKALLNVPGFQRRINLAALSHYLSYKHVPHPLSIFEGISILPPAHLLTFRPGEQPTLRRYWNLDFSTNHELDELSEEELVEQVLALLRQGVERRLMSDVPIGFFLSGGIDSSLSTAIAAELCPGRIKTFTLIYSDQATTPGKDEDRRWATWVAQRYGTEHHEATIEHTSFQDNIKQIITAFDEPFSGVVSTYFLAQMISRHVKVALAGDGADELFASYLSHRLAYPLARYPEYQRTGDSDLIRPFEDQTAFLARLAAPSDWEWRAKLFVFDDDEKLALYSPDLVETMRPFSSREQMRTIFADLTATDPLNRVLEAEFRTFFPDQVMTFVDRLSMAHSLEVRTAFLDTDFVKLVARLPAHLKMRGGETKYLLKRAALRYFPAEMVFRPKEGFVMPINPWLQRDLETYVRDTLAPSRLAEHGLFNASAVARLIDEFYAGQVRHANKILSLVSFQEWQEIYRPCPGVSQ